MLRVATVAESPGTPPAHLQDLAIVWLPTPGVAGRPREKQHAGCNNKKCDTGVTIHMHAIVGKEPPRPDPIA